MTMKAAPAGPRPGRFRSLIPYGYLSPTVLLIFVLMVIPIVTVISYSLRDNVIVNQNPVFTGFANYIVSGGGRDFMRVVVGPNERNSLMTADGRLSQRGIQRVRNAVFSKAYGDADIVSMLTESTDANVKNILTGMLRAAPEVARLRELVDAGARPQKDFVPDLVDAVRRFSALREKGMTVGQHRAQGDLMGDGPSARVVEIMEQLEANARAPKRIADMLRNFVEEIDGQGDPRQAGMFNGEE